MTADFTPERRARLETLIADKEEVVHVDDLRAVLAEIDRLQAALDGAVEALREIAKGRGLSDQTGIARHALYHLAPTKGEAGG